MELELEEAKKKNGSGNPERVSSSVKTPKLQQFNEDKDDIDAYIERFERYARMQKWKEDAWATNLSLLLGGKALDVYNRLSNEEAGDYKKLKVALLRRYNMTEQGFRERFYTSKAEVGESPQQFAARLAC